MSSATSIGIYFGDGRVDLTAVAPSLRGYTIKSVLSFDPFGITAAISAVDGDNESTFTRIKEFVDNNGGKKSDIYAAVSRSDVTLTCLELPSPTEENLVGVLGYELDRYSPYSREEAFFDFRITGRDVEKGTINIVLATIAKEKLEELFELFKSLDVAPKSVEISSTALANGLLHAREMSGGRELLINIDNGNCELIMIENSMFYYSRSARLGEAFGVKDLSLQIDKVLAARGWSVESLSGVLLDGNFVSDSGYAAKELGREIGVECSAVDSMPEMSAESVPGFEPASYMGSLGLALRGVDECLPLLNFMPSEENVKSRKVNSFTASLFVGVVVILALALLLVPLLSGYSRLKGIENEMSSLLPEVRRVELLRSDTMGLKSGLKQLSTSGSGNATLLDLLKELTTVVPEDTWLTNFVYKSDKIEISGYATSASSLIPIIEASPFFIAVEFAAPVTTVLKQTAMKSMYGSGSQAFIRRGQADTSLNSAENLDQFKIKALREVGS